ncbi:MAG: response regulator [Nitrospiraceae bacterium]|nr:response regulator [Nitrospiraceae bacterium]
MARKERQGSIERKILRSILWVGVLPVSFALVAGYLFVREAQSTAVRRTLETTARKTVVGLAFAKDSRLRAAAALAQDAEIVAALQGPPGEFTSAVRKSVEARLNKLTGHSSLDGPSYYSLFDKNGKLLLSTGNLFQEDKEHEGWWKRVTRPEFTRFGSSSEQNRFVVRVSVPVVSPDTNEIIGFFCEDQGVNSLLVFALGSHEAGDKALDSSFYQVAVVDGSGNVRIRFRNPDNPDAPDDLAEVVPDPALSACLTSPDTRHSGSLRLTNYEAWGAGTGRFMDVFLAYERMDLTGPASQIQLFLVVFVPAREVFAPLYTWALFSVLGGSVLIGLFCIIAYRNVHNNIVRPLALLNEGAQIIRQGDLQLKLKIGTGDEIEEVASSFNKMALALNHNISQLEESEEKYRSLITSMRDGVTRTDMRGVVTFLNPAGAEVFGYENEEAAIGQNVRALFLEEIDAARIANQLKKQSYIEGLRIWMKRKDGRAICVELSCNAALDDEGVVQGAEAIFRDVTNSVRLEQQVRERAERISAINQIANVINSSLEVGRLHESLVVELQKLVEFDYASVALLDERGDAFETRQLSPESSAHGEGGPRIDGDASCAVWVARNRKCLLVDKLAVERPEFAGEFPDGTSSCLCVPLYATGRIIGTLKLGSHRASAFSRHDMVVLEEMAPHIAVAMRNARLLENLQHSLEEVTRAREKLHEVNEELKTLDEMKTNLLSNVSHELRTPLVAVMGYADMIANAKVGPVNEVQSEYLGIIMRNVEKLVTLIENLLDFSRLHRGTEKLLFASMDVLGCVRVSMQTVQPVSDSRDIKLELVASDDQIFVEGDWGKLGQVFNNLLSNAVKFNTNGGRVTAEVRKREDSVEIAVSDTGIGIPPEALDKVFTRFYQYDSSSTRKYGGTGIGLSIAQDIVRLHGGRITVTSTPGEGSVFRFSLPLTAQRVESPSTEMLPAATETNLLVELVTGDRALNAHLRTLLTPEGMDVVHAANAEYAIALVHRHNPDCILVHVEGAGNGRTVLDDLLDDPVAASLPILLVTNDDAIYERYRPSVGARVKSSFRKSALLSGIQYAMSQGVSVGDPLGSKVLCVDDDPEVLGFLSSLLKTEGFAADVAKSGQDALERLASHEYGLVLLDIAMPGLDGWEVCRRIRSDASLAGLKVYLVTAKPIDKTPGKVLEVGADGYFLKPFKPDELSEVVHDILPQSSEKDA